MSAPYRTGPTREQLRERRLRQQLDEFFAALRQTLWAVGTDGESAAKRYVEAMQTAERAFGERFMGRGGS